MMTPRNKLKSRMMRFAEGAEVKTFGAIDSDMDTKGTREVENKKSKRERFNEAFAAARKAGNKSFSFEGGKFTTETREEKAAREKRASTGTGTPSSSSAAASAPAASTNRNTGTPAAAAQQSTPRGGSLLMDRPEYAASRVQAKANQAAAKKAEEKAKADREAKAKAEREARAAKLKFNPQDVVKKNFERRAKETAARKAKEKAAAKRESDRVFAQIEANKNRRSMVSGYAKGGKVSSASKRADGIAIRGKTRAR